MHTNKGVNWVIEAGLLQRVSVCDCCQYRDGGGIGVSAIGRGGGGAGMDAFWGGVPDTGHWKHGGGEIGVWWLVRLPCGRFKDVHGTPLLQTVPQLWGDARDMPGAGQPQQAPE